MSAGSGVGDGAGVGGLYLGAPSDRAAATPAETDRVTPSESGGGVGAAYSLGFAARTTPDASVVWTAAGVGAGAWAASCARARAAETMSAARRMGARFFILTLLE
jgi:hypothetical protein